MITFEDIKSLKLSSFASSTKQKAYLLKYNEQYFEINARTADFIYSLQQYNSPQNAIEAYLKAYPDKYTKDELEKSISLLLKQLNTISQYKKTFWYKREIFSSKTIACLTPFLIRLFHPLLMITVIGVTSFLDIKFFLQSENLYQLVDNMSLYVLGILLLFLIGSSLFHELGHATACQHFGIDHGGIGFGIYLNFPVFYTNVSKIWELNRSQRCIVNIAGIYFQIYLLLFILILFDFTNHNLLKYLILVMNLSFAITLNPFFKFDGYWLMTDITGVANLRQRSNEIIIYLYNKLLRKPITSLPYLFCIQKKEKILIIIYTILVNCFIGYYFCYLIPYLTVHFIDIFPNTIRQLIFDLSKGYTIDFNIIQQLFSQLLFFSLTLYFLYRTIQPLFKWKKR